MLAALAIALSVVTFTQQLPQRGKCPDDDGNTPTYYPDPTNCSQFYECSHGYPFLHQCPRNTAFDTHLNVCAYSPGGKCLQEVANVRLATPLSDQPDPRTSRLGDYCPRQDYQQTTFLRDLSNCSRFYICSAGVAYLQHCPHGLEFNAYLQLCDRPHWANCRVRVSESEAPSRVVREAASVQSDGASLARTCPTKDGAYPTFLIDPTDCGRYYECSHGRGWRQACPPGLVFSTVTLTCDSREFVNCNRRMQ